MQDLFAKRFTVLEFETKVDAQNVQDLFTNRFRLFRVRDEGRCTKCSGGSESSLHRISFSIVKKPTEAEFVGTHTKGFVFRFATSKRMFQLCTLTNVRGFGSQPSRQ